MNTLIKCNISIPPTNLFRCQQSINNNKPHNSLIQKTLICNAKNLKYTYWTSKIGPALGHLSTTLDVSGLATSNTTGCLTIVVFWVSITAASKMIVSPGWEQSTQSWRFVPFSFKASSFTKMVFAVLIVAHASRSPGSQQNIKILQGIQYKSVQFA